MASRILLSKVVRRAILKELNGYSCSLRVDENSRAKCLRI